jgi:hypothetical protein
MTGSYSVQSGVARPARGYIYIYSVILLSLAIYIYRVKRGLW